MTPSSAPSDAQLRDCWHALEISSGPLRRRVHQELQSKSGVPGSWIDVLLLLADAPDRRQSMQAAAKQSGLTSGGFTKLADRMQQAGLLSRKHSSVDRRIVYLALTREGMQQAAEVVAVQAAVLRRHLAGLSKEEVLALTEAMQAVQAQVSPRTGVRTSVRTQHPRPPTPRLPRCRSPRVG